MFFSPTSEEWVAIYAPLAVILLVATSIELKTQRIPNWLVLSGFLYLLTARMVVGPNARWQYVVSLLIGTAVGMGLGWAPGLIGGGAAKLLVAVSSGLAPLAALCVSGASVLFARVLRALKRDPEEKAYVPGSVFIFVFTAMVLAVSACR